MFKKSSRKSIVSTSREGNGYSDRTTTTRLDEGQLLDYLKRSLDRHGKLVITDIIDNEIHLTTMNTIDHRKIESKLDGIRDVIYNYINNN